MQITSISADRTGEPVAVALGAFDGLHRGHHAVIQAALEAATDSPRCRCAVLTFSQPAWALPKGAAVQLISAREQAQVLENWGVDEWTQMDFEAVRGLSPEEFVRDILHRKMNAHTVCCGFNYRFGQGGVGDATLLSALCERYGMVCRVVEPVDEDGAPISSSRIRSCVEAGDMGTAARLLGRPFRLDFTVAGGHQRGRGWGFPTLNQPFPEHFVLPRYGVYASFAEVDGRRYPAVTNIGVHPTVGAAEAPLAETYLFGFSGDMYGRSVPVSLVRFVRPETRFADAEALRRQVDADRVQALQILKDSDYFGSGDFADIPFSEFVAKEKE